MFELYTGQQAYWEIPPPMLAYHVTTAGGRPHLPAHCPAPYKLLAEACWAAQPADRWARGTGVHGNIGLSCFVVHCCTGCVLDAAACPINATQQCRQYTMLCVAQMLLLWFALVCAVEGQALPTRARRCT